MPSPDPFELCLRLRSTAADSITESMRLLAEDATAPTADEVADRWIEAAELWEDALGLLALQISVPENMPWLEKVVISRGGGGLDVTAVSELLRSTAAAAQTGADRIREARLAVLTALSA